MIKNTPGKKKTLMLEDKRKMQRLAGILKESMFYEAAPEEEEPLPDAPVDDAPDMGSEPPMDDMGGDDLGGDMGAPANDMPAGPEGMENPQVEKMVDLFRQFLSDQMANGALDIQADGTESVPPADFGGDEGLSDEVPAPEGGEGMEMEDEPEDAPPGLQKEAVPIPSARRGDPVKEKYNQLEEELFESVMRRVRKEMAPKGKPAPTKKSNTNFPLF
jgi:hypothetical protein